MALALRDASRLKPDIRLAQAVSEFEAALTSEQKVAFRASRSSAASTAPTMSDVMRLTAEIDFKATSKHGRGRCFGPRMTNLLEAIQQFAALGDVVVGGSQNLIACGVWAAARMTVHVVTGYFTYLDKLSLLFMAVGRSAPRYQAMAAIYPKSKNLQRYLYEYFIIVTKLCYQSIAWTQKSALGRLSKSMGDPNMKELQSDLEIWSSSIKEEANLLLSQRVDEEARENAKFRSLTAFRSESSSYQRRIKICSRFLQACSQYDYRTIWKQTRKCGTTRLLETCQDYQLWKSEYSNCDSILFRGKLGAGKSVLLANIIDDLNLRNNTITLYFFARYDSPDGLNSRTILGCLIRQLLEHFVTNKDFDHIFMEPVGQLDLDDIVDIFINVPPHDRGVYIVIDGLDECPTEEQHAFLRAMSVIQPYGYKLCVSVRTLDQTAVWKDQPFQLNMSIPEDNPDISDYVHIEVDRRIQDGRLTIYDSSLVKEVKRQLIDGACGMFLWASLQLDSICSEVSDDAIREAIQDLPRDLTETFERNLTKASSKDSRGYHIRIFKLLVSARQLLTTEELREAASVTTGQTIWDPAKQINSIHAVLRYCGSLVMIDEEDNTVRFIHHSARSFCLNTPNNSASWNFTEVEAETSMAETLVTYLSYNVFDTRLSRNVVPKIEANHIPKKVALSTMKNTTVGKGLTDKFLKIRSQMRHDVGPVLAYASESPSTERSQQFFLLSYASKHWLLHTSQLEKLDPSCQWYSLIHHPTFGIQRMEMDILPGLWESRIVKRPPIHLSDKKDPAPSPEEADPIPSPETLWALAHGHILLLKHVLHRDKRGPFGRFQAYCHLWMSLGRLEPQAIPDQVAYGIVKWLCPILVRLRVSNSAKRHLLSQISIFDDFYMSIIREAIDSSDIEALTILLSRENLDQTQIPLMSNILMELAVSSGQLSLVRLMMRKGITRQPGANTAAFSKLVTSSLPDPVVVLFAHCFLLANIDSKPFLDWNTLPNDHLYIALKLISTFTGSAQLSTVLQVVRATRLNGRYRRTDLILHRACMRGDTRLAEALLSTGASANTCTTAGSCLDAVLQEISYPRLHLAWQLLGSSASPSSVTLSRAVLLRQWAFVLYFLSLIQHSNVADGYVALVPQLPDNLEIVSRDMDFTAFTGSQFIGSVTNLSQLPIIRSNSWSDWQFYFMADFYYDGTWRSIESQHGKTLCEEIHKEFTSSHTADQMQAGRSSNASFMTTPEAMETSIKFYYSDTYPIPWLKITIPNSMAIVAEISQRWTWLPDGVYGNHLQSSEVMQNLEVSDKISYLIWDGSDGVDGLGVWLLPESIEDINHRRLSYDLARSGLADAHWAIQEMDKSLQLLHNLPQQSSIDTLDERLPSIRLPRSYRWHSRYLKEYSFGFAYMSVRIQWLRTLLVFDSKSPMSRFRVPVDLLKDLGDIYMVLPGGLELSEHAVSDFYQHGIMPSILEAAFIGSNATHVLKHLVDIKSRWILEVTSWIEQMDTSIFTWSMGENAPISFARAFQSFRDIGVSDGDMELLESSLEHARGRVSELE